MPAASGVFAAQHAQHTISPAAFLLALAAFYVLAAGSLTVLVGTVRQRWPGRILQKIPGLNRSIERRAQRRTEIAVHNMEAAGVAVVRRPAPAHLTRIHARQYFGIVGSSSPTRS
jgi:hypothetical protein